MPNALRNQTAYVSTGNPETFNESVLYKPGELGSILSKNKSSYQLVESITDAIVGQLAFWQDRDNYQVTDLVASSNRNQVAGIYLGTITLGNFCFILTKGFFDVLALAGTYVDGETAIANSGVLAEITRLAVAAPVTFTKVGDVLGARGLNFAGRVPVDVNLLDVE
jgi:hypothetical protein